MPPVNPNDKNHRLLLTRIARQVMSERGLQPDIPQNVMVEADSYQVATSAGKKGVQDLRHLLWCSIDNDDSRDLDQLSVAEELPYGTIRVWVAIADVSALVKKKSAVDNYARRNTATVYTPAHIFPMLPERLSTDLTSLNYHEDRMAMVVEMLVSADGSLKGSKVYQAVVHNHAQLAYNSVAAWLDGQVPAPEALSSVPGLEDNIRLQVRAALALKKVRFENGALDFQTISTSPVFEGDQLVDLEEEYGNIAKEIIENFMIAANGVTARFLASKGFPSIRRVVETPKRWERIVEIAAEYNYTLPAVPNSKALELFLAKAKAEDPIRFPDLSLSVIKLLGAGEYMLLEPGETAVGHFGLAVKDYAHSTAPNRRYPDLITQRLVKAALAGRVLPYSVDELHKLASHCTRQEDAIKKTERQIEKSAAAILLQSHVGEKFDSVVTGASPKGTWVRLLKPPVEGRLTHGFAGLEVGDKVMVRLASVDIERGYIDFERAR